MKYPFKVIHFAISYQHTIGCVSLYNYCLSYISEGKVGHELMMRKVYFFQLTLMLYFLLTGYGTLRVLHFL